MKNEIICQNCRAANNFYAGNCSSCGAILRSRVVNIDLWKTIWELIESPRTAFKNIIFAEHKNFISLLMILIGIKLFVNSNFLLNIIYPKLTSEFEIPLQLVVAIVSTILVVLLLSYILKIILSAAGVKSRLMDNLAVIIFSHVPILLALVLLLAVEYGIFGAHWIYFNPSPYLIKSGSAYLLSGVETIFLIWQLALLFAGMYIQSKNILFSIISALVIETILMGAIGIIPAFIVSLT